MTVGERFEQALKSVYPYAANHIAACVEDTGISQPSISRAKNATELTPSIRKFAKFKGVSLKWLSTGEGEMFETEGGSGDVQHGRHSIMKIGKVGKMHSGDAAASDLPADIQTIVDYLMDMDKEKRKEVMRMILQM